ncbi:MAG: Mrp/NBP35 family ATP-binding protein [Prevotella sp.]|nr:Mrp/NBP35 family ATP-binding protein [Candidatus Prevotella equi]
MTIYPKLITDALATVMYAGKKKNIIESEMLADQPVINGNKVEITLIFPRETDPFLKSTLKAAEAAIHYHVGKDVEVTIKTEFKSAPRPEDDKLLPEVKNIIAVSSGKGGVGKSTVSANLAISLARLGYSVGLLDADIFGPSMPKMFQAEDARPYAVEKDGRQLIEPIQQYGVKVLSIGFFVKPDTATLWRGGMACSALKQLIADADWGELDYLILDTPPGTSDIHLSLLQTLAITGAVIVSTPQQVALADARKGIDMYTNDKVNVPILGLVENMAWFTPAQHLDEKYYIFGKEGCKNLAAEMNVPLLAQIPLIQDICENGDAGTPAALNVASPVGQAFIALAQSVVTVTNRRNAEQEKTKRVQTHDTTCH